VNGSGPINASDQNLPIEGGFYCQGRFLGPAFRQLDPWHGIFGDPALPYAILNRLVHNAYQINLQGASMQAMAASFSFNDWGSPF
jgi:hypothetical protein